MVRGEVCRDSTLVHWPLQWVSLHAGAPPHVQWSSAAAVIESYVSKAVIVCSCLRLNFSLWAFICAHLPSSDALNKAIIV